MTPERKKLLQRITTDPKKFWGKPIVRGLRVPVETVVSLLARGDSAGDILEWCPDLEAEDIRACLAYASAVVAGESLDAIPAAGADPARRRVEVVQLLREHKTTLEQLNVRSLWLLGSLICDDFIHDLDLYFLSDRDVCLVVEFREEPRRHGHALQWLHYLQRWSALERFLNELLACATEVITKRLFDTARDFVRAKYEQYLIRIV